MKSMSLGLREALRLTLESIAPLPAEKVGLVASVGRVAAEDHFALVDSPPMDASRKDGYAVLGDEVAGATPARPVRLRLAGSLAAGGDKKIQIAPGTAVRVLTGARLPQGADAVLGEEFVRLEGDEVLVETVDKPRINILTRGSDVAAGQCLARAGQRLTPVLAGLLAAAGHSQVSVHRHPVVGIVGTGDEIVAPGEPLAEGKLYASNIITLAGFCFRHGIDARLATVSDDRDAMLAALGKMAGETDALITSGGAWRGDRDIVAHVLTELGWKKVFHRIRIGPGKAVGLGMLGQKPAFVLPGGPPSNLMGFLQIALPGILALAGQANAGLPRLNARLAAELREGNPDWTDFFFGALEPGDELPLFHPMKKRSRLTSIAQATAVASIPEGRDHLPAGAVVSVQLL